jgi:sulfite exporter TauE/SafE
VSLELGLVLAGAFLASTHCIGMCGCFAVLVGGGARNPLERIGAQAVYSAGRLFTYAFLGAVCGQLGATLLRSAWGVWLSSLLAYLSGALFVVVGLQILGLWDRLGGAGHRLAAWFSLGLAPAIRQFSGEGTWRGTLLTGVLTGFLPCGLVYAFALKAAAAGNPGRGVLLMLVFGAGTLPAMIGVGLLGTVLSLNARRHLYRATGVVLLVLAALTFMRGRTPWATSEPPACHQAPGEPATP